MMEPLPRVALARRLGVCRDMLEEALLDLPRLPPRVDRRPIVALLDQALVQLAQLGGLPDAGDTAIDLVGAASATVTGAAAMLVIAAPGEAARAVVRRLQSAQRSLEAYRREALDEIVAEQNRARGASRKPPAPRAEPFRASKGVPALHHLDRDPLPPVVRVEAPPAPPPPPPRLPLLSEDLDEDDDVPVVVDGPARRPRAYPWGQLRRLAVDCFEEIGALGNLREPAQDASWSPDLSRFEDRLLADLDAAVALGHPVTFRGEAVPRIDVLRELTAWADDAFVPDPSRAFARAFVLGCVDGDDAIRAAVAAIRQSSPHVRDAQRSALALASSPAVAPAMESLASGSDPALSTLALDVLHDRREVPVAVAAELLSHPDARVRRSAALCLGAASERLPAIALLSSALLMESDDRVAATAAVSLVRLGSREGLAFARKRLGEAEAALDREARLELLRLVAVAGGPEDLERMIAAASSHEFVAEIATVGWYGHPGCVAPLIDTLERACDALAAWSTRAVIAAAIRRILGVEVPPTKPAAQAFRRSWGELGRRFSPSEGERRKAPPRLRFGEPWSPLASLDELAQASNPTRARALLALEVAVVSAGALRLDVRGWVARQLGEIASAREALGSPGSAWQPGEWPHGHLK